MSTIVGRAGRGELSRARLDHCRTIFEREWERTERLEKKSQFYLSFATIFLGAILLKLEFIRQVRETLSLPGAPDWARGAAYTGTVVFVLATFGCLVAVLQSIRLKEYAQEAPLRASETFFAADSPFLRRDIPGDEHLSDEELFLDHAALHCTRAYEYNARTNDRKSAAVRACAASVFFMVLGLAILVSTLVYLHFSLPGGGS